MRSVLPHLLPYAIYVAPGAAADLLPPAWRPWAGAAGVVGAAAALIVGAIRGAYPELRRRPAERGAAVVALCAGFGVALLWMPLTVLVPRLQPHTPFQPYFAGLDAAPWFWAARVVGFVLVIPVAEELLVRSLVPRFTDAPDGWDAREVGAFTARSAAVSVAFFTLTHSEWLAALVTGLLWTALLARTRRLGDVVLSHVFANALLALIWSHPGARDWW
jgi:CAAX protease family protein